VNDSLQVRFWCFSGLLRISYFSSYENCVTQLNICYFVWIMNLPFIALLCWHECFIRFRITCFCYIYLASPERSLAWPRSWTQLPRFCDSFASLTWKINFPDSFLIIMSYFQKLRMSAAFYTSPLLCFLWFFNILCSSSIVKLSWNSRYAV